MLVLTAILGGGAGLGVGLVQPKSYEAKTILLISTPNRTDWNATTGDQQEAKTFTLFPQSNPVLQAAIKATNNPNLTIDQLAAKVTVDYTRDTQYITIRVRDDDPNRAAQLSTEIAKQSVLRFQQLANDGIGTNGFVQNEVQKIEAQIQSTQIDLTATQNLPASPENQTHIKNLNDNLTALRQSYNQIVNTYYLLNSTQPKILQEADVPGKALGSGPLLGTIIGVLAGLLVMAGVLIFVEMNDDTLRTPGRVAQATGLPTLVSVKALTATSRALPLLAAPKSGAKIGNRLPLPEAFLTLNAYLYDDQHVVKADDLHRSLLVTSAENGDGKTLTATQIALGLARTGTPVVLVDANLHAAKIHDLFGLSNQTGLSSLLKETAGLRLPNLLQETPEPNLLVLTAGPVVEAPAELLSSATMSQILAELTQQAFVVIDSPAVLTSSDAVILANKSDMVVMVVNARHTTSATLKHSLELMPRMAANVLGVVLNRVSNKN